MNPTPIITRLDALRLRSLLASREFRGRNRVPLEAKLGRAKIIDRARPAENRVALNSTLLLREADSNVCWMATLVLPSQADVERRRISVASPLGALLLGARSGEVLDCPFSGARVQLTIEAVRHPRPRRLNGSDGDQLRLA